MNSKRNSIIILAKNINMDKEYQNIIDYSESELVSLCENNNHLVAKQNNYSFLKPNTNVINVGINYTTCLQANYIAMQNPSYSNKWFFAFIDRVEYNSESSTNIYYTVDEISTWWSYWIRKTCFVEREHVNDDTVGLHTVPENLETGDYISCKLQPSFYSIPETCFVVATTEQITDSYTTFNQLLPIGLYYYGLTTLQGIQDLIKSLDEKGKSDTVNSVFVTLKDFFYSWGTMTGVDGQISSSIRFDYSNQIEVNKVNYLGNDYVPKNNKLLTFPYSFLQVSNHSGQIVNYNWENFNLLDIPNDGKIKFNIKGTITPGGSMKAYPINYNNILNDYDDNIVIGKLPIGAYNNDVYTNWLTQNGVNIGLNVISSGLQVASGVGMMTTGGGALAGAGNVASGVLSIANTLGSVYQHSLIPDSVSGNVNCGDVNFTLGLTNLEFKRMSIKNEYARIIDNYLTRFGYKVNLLKMPNFTGRKYWNFVKIIDGEIIGYSNTQISIPESSMDTINNVFRKGTTIWHDHDNIGNFNLNNTIVS